jgi:hypothetical protein
METDNVQAHGEYGSYDDMKSQLKMTPQAEPAAPAPVAPSTEAVTQEATAEVNETVSQDGVTESVDTTTEDTATESTTTEQPTVFEVNDFNQRFSTDFKDEDSIRNVLSSVERVSELEAQLKELDSLKEENLLLKESLDPLKYFDTEDDFKVALFKKQFPDKDASVAHKILTKDLSQMSDRDVIAHSILLDNPDLKGGLQGAIEMVNDKYGIDEDGDLDALTENKIKVDARSARSSINTIKSQIQLPDKIDVNALAAQKKELMEQKQAKLKEGWSAIGKEVVSTLPDLVITDTIDGKEVPVFKYSMTRDFPQEVMNGLVETMVNNGVDLSKDAASAMIEVAKEKYISQNFSKIAKAIREDALAKAEEERLIKQHNPGTPKPQAEPPANKAKNDQQRLLADLSGWQPKKMFN